MKVYQLLAAVLVATLGTQTWASSFPDATACLAIDESLGDTIMDWVKPAVRSGDYTVRTGDGEGCSADPTRYVPDEFMDIHVRTVRYKQQFRGFMLYAVDENENRVGEWEIRDPESEWFWLPSGSCEGKSIMHLNGAIKHYHHVFHFQAPPAGTGPITFRALVKRGPANTGEFYWPNSGSDLRLTEQTSGATQWWYKGVGGQSCDEVCSAESKTCDVNWMRDAGEYNVALYKQFGRATACNLPIVESCEGPHVDSDNWCHVPGVDCAPIECSVASEASPLCACGSLGGPPAEDVRTDCLSAAFRGSSLSVLPLFVLSFVTALCITPSSQRASFLLLLLAVLCVFHLPTAQAHNWVGSPSRSRNEASTLTPCRTRFNESIPHFQIGPGQTFEIEWATGHNHFFYFAVVKNEDYELLSNVTADLMDEYIEDAIAAGETNYNDDKYWQKQHVNRGDDHEDEGIFSKQLTEADGDDYISRHERFSDDNYDSQWQYKSDIIAKDYRFEYTNEENPWLVAVHRFAQEVSRPSDRDTARFTINHAGGQPGKYVVHYLWRGYRDCVDVDVFPETVDSVYGREANENDNIWQRIDHCQFEETQDTRGANCQQVITTPDRCLAQCKDDIFCHGVNVVNRWLPPTVYGAFQGEVAMPFADWNCDENLFGNADEKTQVCYGVRARNQNNTHQSYTVSMDPEDPVFYSTCYVKQADWVFDRILDLNPATVPDQTITEIVTDANGIETTIITVIPGVVSEATRVYPWSFGGKCISCADRDHFSQTADVPYWELSDSCEKCDDEIAESTRDAASAAHMLAKGKMCDGQIGADGITKWNFREIAGECSHITCHKDLFLLNVDEMTLEECVVLAEREPMCSSTIDYSSSLEDVKCGCYLNNECCGECQPADNNWGWYDQDLYTLAPDNADPTCADGILSADGTNCCPATCINAAGVGQCADTPVAMVTFTPSPSHPEGYVVDVGNTYRLQESGLTFGWSCDITKDAWDQTENDYVDSIYTTVIRPGKEDNSCADDDLSPAWELMVEPGDYDVQILYMNDNWGSNYISGCTIEGVPACPEDHPDAQEDGDLAVPRNEVWWVSKGVTVEAEAGETFGLLTFAGDGYDRCRLINAIRVHKAVPADDDCQSINGMCCPYELALESRPCAWYSAPCSMTADTTMAAANVVP